jgi:hypothetical protein
MMRCAKRGVGVRLPLLVGVLLLALLADGCGPQTGTIFGTVTYNGEVVPGGDITFHPQEQPGKVFTSVIQPDGSYKVPKVPVGPAGISIQDPGGPVNRFLPGTEAAKQEAKRKIIPRNWNTPDQSGLNYTVVGGSQEHNIELK